MHIRLVAALALACTVLVLLAAARPGLCDEPGEPDVSARTPAILTVIEENDYFAGTDNHYTNGTKLLWVSGDLKHYADDQRLPRFVLPAIGILPFVNQPGQQYNLALALGQNMYTPTHLQVSSPQPTDRPYAGWTYVSLGLHAKTPDKLDTFEATVGFVGPESYAAQTQNAFHSLIGDPPSLGWRNQIHDEPGIILTWQRTQNLKRVELGHDLAWDFLPHVRASVGNVETLAAAGFETRFGFKLPRDFGTSLIQPGGGVSEPVASDDTSPLKNPGFGMHLFAGAEGRAVARNIFLDGNTFEDSPRVSKYPFVADLFGGVGVEMGRFKLTYTQVFRTDEFYGQKKPQLFGSISLAMTF
ncbi:MAG: lipid A deacylase LpxR family protein [Desulfovibrionaceae bacterium]|nr:lipid A deacylase LpxR family protein [Desulfovibrionaceae bacterium]MBF0514421.1 lipid A deacylase LpxR family protein [Desulfovibrionaceae bacterium]